MDYDYLETMKMTLVSSERDFSREYGVISSGHNR